MAFTLAAIVGSTTVTLSDGNPFTLRTARGMGGADVRRVTTQGPSQHGDTDKGYRLQPREIELVIGFRATTDTILDGYRDTLMGVFKPLPSTPVNLRVTRDDGEIRQIDCNVVGGVDIKLVKEHRPGHYHEATVRLRAADPAWYELAPGTVSVAGSTIFGTNWWLAGGAIGTAQVLMSGGTPSSNATWSYSGTTTTSWTLAVQAAYVSAAGTTAWMFTSSANPGANYQPRFGVGGTATYGTAPPYYAIGNTSGTIVAGTTAMLAGTQVYFFDSAPGSFDGDIAGIWFQPRSVWLSPRDSSAASYYHAHILDFPTAIVGTAMQWRTLGWSGAIPKYALYQSQLTPAQRAALVATIKGTAAQSLAVLYEGDLPEYPVISLTGPITGPSIENTTTGEILDFGTIAIGAGTTYVINTDPLYRTVLAGTVNKRGELTKDSDLGEWHIAPDPVATGGTNLLVVNGTGVTGATTLQIIYYNRFQSY